jgi:hypothetical protein
MLPRTLLMIMALALGLTALRGVTAQSTPVPGQAGCTVEPRADEEIAQIKATPVVATPAAATPRATRPADEQTIAELQRVVDMAEACAAQGDYNRLAALYSDDAIQAGVLDAAEQPIEPGTPPATPSASPPPGKYGPPHVSDAWWIDEIHVIAEIERGPSIREQRFVREDDRWLIDSNEVVTGEVVEDIGTPNEAAALPVEVLQSIVDLIATETGAEVQTVTITAVEPVNWPDTFLGCPVEGSFAAQVITPGYRVMVEYQGKSYEVHTDTKGHAVTC